MKLAVITLAVVAYVVAAPASDNPDANAQVIRSDFDQHPEGGYKFNFETENKISRQETGEVKEVNDENNKLQKVVVVRGTYSFPDQDGNLISITYEADENGYHAEGDSIPKA